MPSRPRLLRRATTALACVLVLSLGSGCGLGTAGAGGQLALRLLELRGRQGLYAENGNGVEISDGVLYRASISIPSQVPVGTYTAETFLIDREGVLRRAWRKVKVPGHVDEVLAAVGSLGRATR